MVRKLIVSLAVFACFSASAASAEEHIGLGVHIGAHHDVGNFSDQNPSAMTDPQNSLLLGFSFKANIGFVFLRTGFDYSYVLNRGKVLENSDTVASYSIKYVCVPGFLGFRFPVRERGEFYMGAGMAYFITSGDVKLASGASEDISAISYGYGIITGIEFKLLPEVRLYMEWEYFDARSDAQVQTTGSWKNYYVDYTGHRVLLGVMYYLL